MFIIRKHIKRCTTLILVLIQLWISAEAFAFLEVEVENNKSFSKVFVLSSDLVDISSFFLEQPSRLVLDIKTKNLGEFRHKMSNGVGIVKAMRHGLRELDLVRVVLELNIEPSKLTLDRGGETSRTQGIFYLREKKDIHSVESRSTDKSVFKVVVDAGHGGIDSGAVGPTGVLEKDITLAVSYHLANFINGHPRMQAIMSRRDDSKIRLRQRVKVARESNADLFLSIHADAIDNRQARGSSVYVLSQRGASSEIARMLAKKSNESDFIGSIKREKKDENLWETLVDLSQRATIDESIKIADSIIKQLGNFGPVHQPMVQYAGFMVLKALDIPSVLIETAFISNPFEEKRLRETGTQIQIASWIYRGVCDYFGLSYLSNNDSRTHLVVEGDTLSEIAYRFNVSLIKLKQFNNLKSDVIKKGDLLKIPANN